MRILVTGGAGFIGSNLVRHLITSAEHQVLNLDALTYAGATGSLHDLDGHARYRFVQANIGNAPLLEKIFADFRPDWVMHLAAESHVDRSIDSPAVFLHTNITGTYTLLQAARTHFETLTGPERDRFRFLHVSTDEVYGSLGTTGLFCETTPYDPRSPYSASKAASDHLVRAWAATYGLPVLVTNCSNNYGPYQFPEKLIPMVILKALRGEPIPLYGNGENIRDWLYVEDHVQALHTVITRGRSGETYTIGGNHERRNIDLVEQLCSLLDEFRPRANGQSYSAQITFVKDRPGHDFRYAIDTAKIKAELGWTPQQDLASGLRKTVHWYLENQAWWQAILDRGAFMERKGLAAPAADAPEILG